MKFKKPTAKLAQTLFASGLFVCISGCSTLSEPSQEDPDKHLSQMPPAEDAGMADALTHFSMGILDELDLNSDTATEEFLEAIKSDPDNESLYYITAEKMARQDRKDDAEAIILALAERQPKSPKPLLWLAWMKESDKKPLEAMEYYSAAVKKDKKSLLPYIKLALLQNGQKDTDTAVKTLNRAIKKADDPLKAIEVLGELYRKQAETALDSESADKNNSLALATYEKGLKEYPEANSLLYQSALLNCRKNNVRQAMKHFMKLEELNPDSIQLKEQIVFSLLHGFGDQGMALAKVNAYLEENPDNGLAHYYAAQLHESERAWDEAIEHFKTSAKLEPIESAPFWKVSVIESGRKNDEAAFAVLEEGIAQLPDNSRLLEMKGNLFDKTGEYAKAVELYQQVEELVSADGIKIESLASFNFKYAIAAERSGDLDKAKEKLVIAGKSNPILLTEFGRNLFRQEEGTNIYHVGTNVFSHVVEALPEVAEAHYTLGLFHSNLEQFKQAAKHYRQAEQLAVSPQESPELLNAFFYFLYGSAEERIGNFDFAEAQFMKCLDLDPENSETWNYAAYMWSEQGRKLKKAHEYVDRALEIEPENPAYIDTKGWIFYKQKKYDKALPLIEKAAKLLPDDPTIQDHLAEILYKLNREEEAFKLWEKAVIHERAEEGMAERIEQRKSDWEAKQDAAKEENSTPEIEVEEQAADEAEPEPASTNDVAESVSEELAPAE